MTEVASGWTVDESGRLRRETVHSMKRRCRDWDYRSRCIYMITVELADRRSKTLGRLKVADGERQIAHEALSAKLKLITMANKGFSKLQKPGGRYFDATAMNRLCQWIAGEDAAEINYHGMKPENIDALARGAAKVDAL